jgi:hypothetical protein
MVSNCCAQATDDGGTGCRRVSVNRKQRIVVDKGVSVKTEPAQTPQEALYAVICWYLGVDGTYGWQPSLPSADGLRPRAERWVEKVTAHDSVWPSQAAAVEALVLHGASPLDARRAAQAAYASGR